MTQTAEKVKSRHDLRLDWLIDHPDELIKKRPFTRGGDPASSLDSEGVEVGEFRTARLPDFKKNEVSQRQFIDEFDPARHKIHHDENVPSITVKLKTGGYCELEFKRMGIPIQKMICSKQVQHLCGNKTVFTLDCDDPTDAETKDFATFKKYWKKRNMDGMRMKMVAIQKAFGDAGLLFYFDRKGRIKCRLLSYEDGYVLCPHNDDNGDRLLESVYYKIDGVEHIDSYSDEYCYHHVKDVKADKGTQWRLSSITKHGFDEIPLVTKRGDVAWNAVQDEIEVFEVLYNVFIVIQKRHGWGVLYIKGKFSEKAKKIAGSVILNDASMNKDGDAKYLTPPTPEGMLETLKSIFEQIQMGSSTTFILPKDISMGADISGVAIQVAQSLDNEEARRGSTEWQNVISKMTRLFLYGLGQEFVNTGKDLKAFTRLSNLEISAYIKPWSPRSDSEYNQMLSNLAGSGLISYKTGIEKNTESTPDEEKRLEIEGQKADKKAEKIAQQIQNQKTDIDNEETDNK